MPIGIGLASPVARDRSRRKQQGNKETMKSKVLWWFTAALLIAGVSAAEANQGSSPLAVPEPASLMLLGTGLGVMALTIRRWRKKKR